MTMLIPDFIKEKDVLISIKSKVHKKEKNIKLFGEKFAKLTEITELSLLDSEQTYLQEPLELKSESSYIQTDLNIDSIDDK